MVELAVHGESIFYSLVSQNHISRIIWQLHWEHTIVVIQTMYIFKKELKFEYQIPPKIAAHGHGSRNKFLIRAI